MSKRYEWVQPSSDSERSCYRKGKADGLAEFDEALHEKAQKMRREGRLSVAAFYELSEFIVARSEVA